MTHNDVNLMPLCHLHAAASTDRGRRRKRNEDRYHLDLERGIFLVVDGVGGHAAGDVAAETAVSTILERLGRPEGSLETRVREAIAFANQRILQRADAAPELSGMACVLTLAVLDGVDLTIGHVGDSRFYKFTSDEMVKLTHDHSPVGEREDTGQIAEAEAMQHERRHEVSREVGSQPQEPDAGDFVEVVRTTIEENTSFLICSDGLSDMLRSREIDHLVRMNAGAPQAVVDSLIAAANEVGGSDNITVIYAEGRRFAQSRGFFPARVRPPAITTDARVPTAPLISASSYVSPSTYSLSSAAMASPITGALPVSATAEEGRPATPGGDSPGVGAPALRAAVGRTPFNFSSAAVFAAGLAIAVSLTWGLASRTISPAAPAEGPRHLTVGRGSNRQTIAQALAAARKGDVIEIEPGQYTEAIELRDGVDLVASGSGEVVLVAEGNRPDWVAITARSGQSTVQGLRIAGYSGAPMRAGILLAGGRLVIRGMTFQGQIDAGIHVAGPASHLSVSSSWFERVTGVPISITGDAIVDVQRSAFIAADQSTGAPITFQGSTKPTLFGNVFLQFVEPLPAAAADAGPGAGNLVVTRPVEER